ncbi:hypothetical protein EVV31_26105, partial [Klebsiella pneumoniae]
MGRRAAGGAAGDGSVVSRRLAGRFPGAADAPAAPQLLAQIAPGVVWVAALLAALLVMDRLFRDD